MKREIRLRAWRRWQVALATLLGVIAAEPGMAQDGTAVRVVATFSVLGDMVKNVAGDKVALTTLVGPDADTHLYQPTPADARAIAEARLIVANGLGFEGWLGRAAQAAGFRGTIATASDGVTVLGMEHAGAGGGSRPKRVPDPHAWQDLKAGQIYVANIVRALSAVDPGNARYYEEHGGAYGRQLGALDATVRAALAEVPEAKRRVITSHDSFAYYGRAYGVEFKALVGVSTESEPTASDIARLIQQMRKERTKALFIENMADRRMIDQLAQEAGAAVGPPLYSDALSRPAEPASTYVRMFEYNTAALKAGMLKN
jgi:zinc/manganese transport system substrate-binding protein